MKPLLILLLAALSCPAVCQINLNNGLIGYYPFNGNANDASGNGFHGTVRNGASLTTDKYGNANSAYFFDGIDDFIEVNDNGGLSPVAVTVVALVNTVASTPQTIVGKIGYSSGNAATYHLGINYDVQAGFFFGTVPYSASCFQQYPYDPANPFAKSTTGFTTNEWHCVVGSFKDSVLKIYVDGVLRDTKKVNYRDLIQCNNTQLLIGSWWAGDNVKFRGKIDEVRIYDRPLNDLEISALCNMQSCSNWLSVPSQPSFVQTGDLDVAGNVITVEATFNKTAANAGGRLFAGDLVSKHSGPNDCNYLLRPNHAEITTSNGYFITPEVCEVELNKTYHVAMVYDGSTLKFYRNGFLLSQVAASGNLVQNNWQTRIGYYFNQLINTNFIGYINEVRIWNVARTQTELRNFMTSSLPAPATQTGLLAYYSFDNLLNKQGNPAWNGTLGGSALINQTNPTCASYVADSCCVTPAGTLAGSNICVGAPATLTFNATLGAGPFTLTYTDGTNNYTQNNVQSGVPFVVPASVLTTTVYTLLTVENSASCGPKAITGVNATVVVSNCALALCTGSLGDPVVNITFGAGANPAPPLSTIVPGASTTLSFVAVNGNPATPTPVDGQYTITNNVPSNGPWFSGRPDHTPNDNNGYMAFYNSRETAGLEFYRQRVDNLCGSTTYEFAAWIANCLNGSVMNGVDPNITFMIERLDGTPIAAYNTGNIPEASVLTWNQFGFLFTMPASESSVILKMVNNSVGGTAQPGNDLAIDDITFRPCGPSSNASFNSSTQVDSLRVCAGDPVTMYSSLSAGYNTPNYRWQMSADDGITWTDVPSSSNFQLSFTAAEVGTTKNFLYRLVAGDGININSENCRITSNKIVLTIVPRSICQLTGTPISGVINSYAEVLSFDKCTNSILVGNASEFNVGDTVIIMQMKGAIIDSSNSAAFGTILNYRNAGNYEYNYIAQKNGNSLVLRNIVTRAYNIPDGIVQLIRVPYYTTATVVNTLTSLPWNGRIGGVLAFDVRDELIMAADLDVSGKGFRGGNGYNIRALQTNCSQNQFVYPSGSQAGAPKGESIMNIGTNYLNGKGSPASAGGGGLDHNSGGGGGANGGIGGFGGFQLESCTNGQFDNRGLGGKLLTYSNANNKIFMGGGGGSGHANQPSGINMDGGNGGGIIILRSNNINAHDNNIIARGASPANCSLANLDNCHDASGGGGGGGTILIESSSYLSAASLNASGGRGGNLVILNNVGGGRIGTGGGGGGGVIWLNNPAQPAQVTSLLNGGSNGVILQDNGNPWGATPGQAGLSLYNLQIPTDTELFVKNIVATQVRDTLVGCRNIQFNGAAIVQRDAISNYRWDFGDATIVNSTSGNITHAYARAGSYRVKLTVTDVNNCQDSTFIDVRVDTVRASVVTVPAVCINEAVVLQGSGGGQYSWAPSVYLNDNSLQNPTAVVDRTTTFVLTVTDSSLCSDTAALTVNVIPKPNFLAPSSDYNVCIGKTVQLNGNNGNNLVYNWTPATFLNDPTVPNPVSSPTATTQYTLNITEPTCNYDTSFLINVNVNPSPIVSAEKLNDIDCSNPSAQLLASGAVSYVWAPSMGLSSSTAPNPVANITSTTTFTVTGTNANGCSASDTVSVKVTNGGNVTFVLPNAFTPNGDGRNDCFGIQRWGGVTIKEFSIFNRWGQVVFTTKDPSQCWDGKVNGKTQDSGGYAYVIKATSFCGDIVRTGIVMLIR